MELLSRPFHSRTVFNCRAKPKPSAAAGALPNSDYVEMGGGNTGGETAHNSGVDKCNITPILQDNGQSVRELVETAKLKKKCSKCACERDDMASKVLNMLEKDDDEDESVTGIGFN